jgi:sterol desaturase/sphingolipid hydroxylase (fatty acid hydroxylase superfamily)
MWLVFSELTTNAVLALVQALRELLLPGLVFTSLAALVKGQAVIVDGRRALREMCRNLLLHCFDALLIAPPLLILIVSIDRILNSTGVRLLTPETWTVLPPLLIAFMAVFAADFIGYWRHRLEHTRWLWPSHALHHSDTEMNWLSLSRFHPLNRLSTALVDFSLLGLLGFPPFAIIAAVITKNLYGHFIHADLPWTLGRLQFIFVSPVMHRWHHADDPAAFGTNFATIFSVFDRAFGTYRVPGLCDAPLGVRELYGAGLLSQLFYPLRSGSYKRTIRPKLRNSTEMARQSSPV